MNYYDEELINFFQNHSVSYEQSDSELCFDWLEKEFIGEGSSLIDRIEDSSNEPILNLHYQDTQKSIAAVSQIITMNQLYGKVIYFGDNIDYSYIFNLKDMVSNLTQLLTLTPQNHYLLDEEKKWVLHLSFYNEILYI